MSGHDESMTNVLDEFIFRRSNKHKRKKKGKKRSRIENENDACISEYSEYTAFKEFRLLLICNYIQFINMLSNM